jgi:hypothetical protein
MPPLNKGSFAQSIGTFKVGTMDKAERIRRGIILKLFGAVILDTPVDTGRLRGNWRTSEQAPALAVIDRIDKGGSLAMQEVQSNMGDGTGRDTSVFLANNLPYAAKIEYEGWSKVKAPQGMVRRNVARINELVSRAAKEGKL